MKASTLVLSKFAVTTRKRMKVTTPDMSVRQVANLLQVHPQTVQRWIREGRLDAYRVGDRLLRVTVDAVETFLREHGR